MKKNILLVSVGFMLSFIACEPIEERNELNPLISKSDINIEVTVDGNTVHLIDNTPEGGARSWDWQTGYGNDRNIDVYLPLEGTYTITHTFLNGSERIDTKQDVVIEQSDPEYYSSPLWELLTNGTEGKTWVWATDKPGATIWGVAPWFSDAQIVNGTGIWWGQNFPDLASQGTSADDEMYFDLNKAHNYTLTQPGANAKPGSGSGSFDMNLSEDNMLLWSADGSVFSYGTITFTKSTIPIASNDGGDYHYTYDILKLTADELVLAYFVDGVDRAAEGAWGPCWVYQFKRKGYTYK